MSLELHVLIADEPPDRVQWQAAINRLGFPVTLDGELDLARSVGFSPCRLQGEESGFELHRDAPGELRATYPSLADIASNARHAISFRCGGDLGECACVMAAAAALVDAFGGLAYYPADDLICDLDSLRSDFKNCLSPPSTRTATRRLTKRELAGFFGDYRRAFPDWDVQHDVVLVRADGLLQQRITFEALSSGAYRPACAVYVQPLNAQLLFRFLDVRHRQVLAREHPRRCPLIIKAMEEQFEPPVRKALDAADVLKLAEQKARRDSIENANYLIGLAALNAHLDRTERAMAYCQRIIDSLASSGRPPAPWEVGRVRSSKELFNALRTGQHHAHLEALTAASAPRAP
jgi:hypothetical protein